MCDMQRIAGNVIRLGAAAALSVCAVSAAVAGSVTQPGETVGIAAGAPLPEGVYFVNTADWGVRNTTPNTDVGVDIPVIAWATPWKILGGRIQLLAATPMIEAGVVDTTYNASFYNPAVLGQIAWDLGHGFGFSYAIGGYFEVHPPLAWSSTSLNQRFALSYTGDGWDLTANVIYGNQFNHITNRPQISPCPAPNGLLGCNPDFINVDLTATKKFGKWEFGLVGYGSGDLSTPVFNYARQSQFALGGLLGYNFGPLTMQFYLTRDVYEQNYGGYDTRGWGRVIIPLWTPPAPVAAMPVKAPIYK